MTRFVLGTAQFGAGYGVTNSVGRLSDEAVRELTRRALARGVGLFDTAANYDDAQSRLGGALAAAGGGGEVITKFSLPASGEATEEGIVGASLRSLAGAPVHGILLHRVEDLRDPRFEGALRILRAARADGVVSRIGVSIYDESDLATAVEVFADLDLIQIPGSVLDRRLLDSPALAALHANGVEVHVRSAFLQGLLLADPATLAPRFAPLVPQLVELRRVAEGYGIPLVNLLVQQLRDHPVTDAVVIGATAVSELDEALDAFESGERDRVDLAPLPVEVVDPRMWR